MIYNSDGTPAYYFEHEDCEPCVVCKHRDVCTRYCIVAKPSPCWICNHRIETSNPDCFTCTAYESWEYGDLRPHWR